MSSSVAAVVHGYATLRADTNLRAVILNRVGSPGHETLLREALEPLAVPVVGALPRDDDMSWRDRHLGLVPVVEQRPEVAAAIDRLAALVARHVDLAAVAAIAAEAPPVATPPPRLPASGPSIRVGVAGGRAFSFTYTDTLDALEAAGAAIVPVDPLSDESLPTDLDGLLLGGGFPEVYGADLAANHRLMAELRQRVAAGLPCWAECGGLLLLAGSLDGHPMAGVVPARATMTDRLTLGYRRATTRRETPLGPTGTTFRGHEFHYSAIEPAGDALLLSSRWGERPEGFARPNLLATYVHHHPGGDPGPLTAFARTCALRSALRRPD
jgi:cobyrinic acid a,c-diamide synthase